MSNYEVPAESTYYSLEAEQSVLGAIIIDGECLRIALEKLKPESFYLEEHRGIFAAAARMFTSGKPVDVVTLLNEIINDGVFVSDGDAKNYVARLAEVVPTAENVSAYVKIVEDKYNIREIVKICREIISQADGADDADELLEFAENKIYNIRQGKQAGSFVHVRSLLLAAFERLQRLSGPNRKDYIGLRSGFSGLDDLTTGLNKSDLILVAARPGMGKTSFVMNIAQHVAKSQKNVAVFSLEMSGEQLVTRLMSSAALVDSRVLKTGQTTNEDWKKIASASDNLSRYNLFIDDSAGIKVGQMKAKLRRMSNLGLVIIDYLQLMTGERKNDNRVAEVSEITRSLKIMAKELDVPVICCSQLSRGPELRQNHRPMLADLRESGSIEQDADIVIFLYRESYYDRENGNAADVEQSECIIAKNRHGETGTAELLWDGRHTRFVTPAHDRQ